MKQSIDTIALTKEDKQRYLKFIFSVCGRVISV